MSELLFFSQLQQYLILFFVFYGDYNSSSFSKTNVFLIDLIPHDE